MLTALEHVKPENLQATNKYLGGQAIQRVELLLRATHPTEQPALEGTPLRRITDEYQKRETTKFEQRLQQLDYDLENVATVQLVTRNRRVEHVSFLIPSPKYERG